MKKISKILWGAVLVAVGVLIALRSLDIIDFDIFFKGWWTLFIIIPCAIGLITERDKTGNFIGVLIGVFLLLCARGVLSFSMLWKLLVPIIIVLVGLKLIFGSLFDKQLNQIMDGLSQKMGGLRDATAVFSGQKLRFDGEVFEGIKLEAVFGGIDCDLRAAQIPGDCVIKVNAVFGGVNIFLPDNVNLQVKSNSLFGGVSQKRCVPYIEGAPMVYIQAGCLFGGVEVK